MSNIVLLIDGDVLCHHACGYDRWKKHAKKYLDAYIVELDENGDMKPIVFSQADDIKYFKESWENFKSILDALKRQFFSNDVRVAIGDRNNFRLEMYPEYKDNRRKQNKKNSSNRGEFVERIKKKAMAMGYATFCRGIEADDQLRMWAEELRAQGSDYVVCTIDKDLKCIPGKFWDMKNQTLEEIPDEYAMQFYYQQLLSGDATDNIPGIPGVGPVTAERLVKGITSEEDLQEIVVSHYIAAFSEDWYDQLMFTGKLIYLLKSEDDAFNPDEWPLVRELRELEG